MNESFQDWFDACSAPQIFDFDIQLEFTQPNASMQRYKEELPTS